ncbi:amastin-like protein [Leptomonas pyrrhocoris]|uniref:Amastin-like protein n=1 Tax=Leptomonas pyrrhocoris TaxID=157538 RepID=A0A0M9G9F4_LEPPY|nr:amastin-like protein [Leptomonas pyrrhocoris]KPA85346.1 amastin-like protein [Leptomonas pyrrhocoris]|eukprot:XP_015663785.1 amastin-like protein [Leptomonas pyrrhocoris]
MSQIARAKKMFDDISSDEESNGSGAAVPSSGVPAQHADPQPAGAGAARANKAESLITSERAEADANAFVPKSASASQAREAQEVDQSPQRESPATNSAEEAPGATMVTRVEVSPPPKEAPTRQAAPSDVTKESATAKRLRVTADATPAKSAAVAAGASSYSTPATVSKRPAEREEREAAGKPRGDSSVRKDRKGGGGGASAKKEFRYKEREEVQDAAAFSTTANRNESRMHRNARQREEEEMQHSPYSTTSNQRATAAQLEFSREEGHPDHAGHAALLGQPTSDEESEVEDFPFASYVFPRLDPALADYQGSHTAVGATKRGEECPPNACERGLAYLMVTDIRMAVYLGVLFLSIVFLIVSIPTSQLDMIGKSCFTYWGFKSDCDVARYTYTRPMYPCGAIRTRLGAGAAFSIITLMIYVVNLTATVIAICCLKHSPHKISLTSRVVVGAVGLITVVTQLISWAVIAGIHSSHYCLPASFLAYGVGFGLNVTSWILNLLGVVFVIAVPSRLVNRHQRS